MKAHSTGNARWQSDVATIVRTYDGSDSKEIGGNSTTVRRSDFERPVLHSPHPSNQVLIHSSLIGSKPLKV
ncbi:hypothetical protein DOTSEDRAFT_47192 [Dothistroma septosporum NZE10]|uniref:Uncharacterized protein n=1 Tax=Dothistroma septosporum (strain NZE10 / CBS 128990) TaxID=675120 RepID=N1PE95_DOTSN|nr:hypothetical protein DOTSEDRAFT_47192 [Dothistroma septosporum NZE10]